MVSPRKASSYGLFLFLAAGTLVVSIPLVSGQPAALAQEGASQADVTPADSSAPPPNLFKHIMRSAGFFFGPLMLIVSIGLVALIVLLAMDLRMTVAIPPSFVD